MEISIADQIALDDALVAPADRLKIGKCNLRLSSDVTSKEATLQVVYDVYKAVRLRFSDPMIQPEPEGSTQGYPLVSVEVLRLCKMVVGDFRYSDTTHLSRSVEVLKLKNFKKDATLKLFKNGMSMSVQKSQVHKVAKLQDGVEIVLG
ncbi:hypothetical protein Tco_1217098 [Tanacetum coccineum]